VGVVSLDQQFRNDGCDDEDRDKEGQEEREHKEGAESRPRIQFPEAPHPTIVHVAIAAKPYKTTSAANRNHGSRDIRSAVGEVPTRAKALPLRAAFVNSS
jgi:hypothetical protein